MRKGLFLAMFALLCTAAAGILTAEDGQRTLNGEFDWNGRAQGPLEAVFTPTGDGSWDVAFHFEFRNKPHTYSGTATGSLSDGELNGQVQNEDQKRSFEFRGTFADGKFKGTHEETTPGRARDTGSMTLGE